MRNDLQAFEKVRLSKATLHRFDRPGQEKGLHPVFCFPGSLPSCPKHVLSKRGYPVQTAPHTLLPRMTANGFRKYQMSEVRE
jgi:hypothetical protein